MLAWSWATDALNSLSAGRVWCNEYPLEQDNGFTSPTTFPTSFKDEATSIGLGGIVTGILKSARGGLSRERSRVWRTSAFADGRSLAFRSESPGDNNTPPEHPKGGIATPYGLSQSGWQGFLLERQFLHCKILERVCTASVPRILSFIRAHGSGRNHTTFTPSREFLRVLFGAFQGGVI